jgi:hypothetical protein
MRFRAKLLLMSLHFQPRSRGTLYIISKRHDIQNGISFVRLATGAERRTVLAGSREGIYENGIINSVTVL